LIKKTPHKASSDAKRQLIAEETEAFLKGGHKITHIPDGISGLEPKSPGKPVTQGLPKQ